jgi:hypothetical protein
MKVNKFIILIFVAFIFAGVALKGQRKENRDDIISKPFDLIKFKKARCTDRIGLKNKTSKHYYPKENKPGRYCDLSYRMPGFENERYKGRGKTGLIIESFKPDGKYQDQYNDPYEVLIFAHCCYNDSLIPNLKVIGKSLKELTCILGTDFIKNGNFIVYQSGDNALLFEIRNEKIHSWIYSKFVAKIHPNTIFPKEWTSDNWND